MAIKIEAIRERIQLSRTENFEFKTASGEVAYLPTMELISVHPDEAATFLDPKRWGGVINQARSQMATAKAKRIADLEAELAKLKGPQV